MRSTPLWSPLSSAPCRTFGPDSGASTSRLEGSPQTVRRNTSVSELNYPSLLCLTSCWDPLSEQTEVIPGLKTLPSIKVSLSF